MRCRIAFEPFRIAVFENLRKKAKVRASGRAYTDRPGVACLFRKGHRIDLLIVYCSRSNPVRIKEER